MEPLFDPFDSSEPPTPTPTPRDLGELPTRLSKVVESNETTPRAPRDLGGSISNSLGQNTPIRLLPTSAAQLAPVKRGPSNNPTNNQHINKTPRINTDFNGKYHQSYTYFQSSQTGNTSQKLVLKARDLLIRAYSATKSRDK